MHAFADGILKKEVLDHMLQNGSISPFDWLEIQSYTKQLMTREEIKEKYGIEV